MSSTVLLISIVAVPAPAQEVGETGRLGRTVGPSAPSVAQAANGSFVVVARSFSLDFTRLAVMARRFDPAGVAVGTAFEVGAPAEAPNMTPAVAGDDAGNFMVVWKESLVSPAGGNIVARRYAAGGIPLGAAFLVNGGAAYRLVAPAVAMTAAGASLVVWTNDDGAGPGVQGRAYDASGVPRDAEFRVNVTTVNAQVHPAVALNGQGEAMVVWDSRGQDGDGDGVYARRLDASGGPLGAEFRVNTFTTGIQAFPAVASLADDGFVVAWISSEGADDAGQGVLAQRYDAAGAPLGTEFRVGATTIRLAPRTLSIAPDGNGGFAIAWGGGKRVFNSQSDLVVRRYDATSHPLGEALAVLPGFQINRLPGLASDRAGRLVLAWEMAPGGIPSDEVTQRYGAAWPTALHVDEAPSATANGNGVLDPGEVAVIGPAWHNTSPNASALTGVASSFTGPGAPVNPGYLIVDGVAAYGTLPAGGVGSCDPAVGCYALGVTAPSPRPARHMDATFLEQLTVAPGENATREWTVHIGGSFDDVAPTSPFYRFVETLMHFGISGGCTATSFCADAAVTREQMAAFLLVTKLTNEYIPPRPPMGVFTDVPATDPFAPWVEDLWNREVVEGCGPDLYCPLSPVTRAQMAVMVLRTAEGTAYVPPPCTTPVFGDVPCTDPFARWINELAARGVTAGCGGGNYCPGGSVTRGQMAVFLSRAFRLDLNAPARMRDLPLPQ